MGLITYMEKFGEFYEELEIFKMLKRFVAFVERYFKDSVDRIEDYTLTDMNHRFKAILELGISKVLVELV